MEQTALHKFRKQQQANGQKSSAPPQKKTTAKEEQPAPPVADPIQEEQQIETKVQSKAERTSSLLPEPTVQEKVTIPATNTSKLSPIEARRLELQKQYPNGLGYQLAPYERMVDTESHLDLANLTDDGPISKEKARYFVCSICSMMAIEAKECADCNSVYCEECIEPWRERGGCCPKKCCGTEKTVQVRDLHRYAKHDLCSLEFKCRNASCEQICKYADALKHLQSCPERFQKCPNGCGIGIAGKDIEYHNFMQCPNYKPICPDCGCEEQPLADKERQHNCIEALKLKLAQVQKVKPQTVTCHEYVEGFDIKKVRCGSEPMKKMSRIPDGYLSACCDACGIRGLEKQAFYFHCDQNNYDMCFICALRQQKLLNSERQDDADAIQSHVSDCQNDNCQSVKLFNGTGDEFPVFVSYNNCVCVYCRLNGDL